MYECVCALTLQDGRAVQARTIDYLLRVDDACEK
jgi:hypothetical protein